MPAPSSHLCRVLVAEDDSDDCRLLADAFRLCGVDCAVEFFPDGVRLLEALRDVTADQTPQLVLLDLNMPRLDGRETLNQLRADPRFARVPVVVMSTSAAEDDASRSRRAGCDAYFVKPVEFGALVDLVGVISRRWLAPSLSATPSNA
ncbi:response regulator [Aquimonas sp.]|jgi:CheY-like chemotaxis protein|uniref:response regulator n=1 Tax=Aquimonas sp. TaxID=1872588 RepID=UPI0037BF8E11